MSESDKPKIRRPVSAVEGGAQVDMFESQRATPGSRRRTAITGFVDPDPTEITIGTKRLGAYLQEAGLFAALAVRSVVREQKWTEFEAAYRLTGRRPYHPAVLWGLVLFGIMSGKSSLRELEELAKRDVGAMWVTGGVCPDHTTIGRFLQMHAERLTGVAFEQLAVAILRRMGSRTELLAGDGTVVEAAGSRFQTLKLEAAQALANQAKQRAEASPNDPAAQEEAEKTQAVASAAELRAKKRQERGDKVAATRVCTTEPEAPVLKGKRGEYVPAYTPSIVATPERIIVAQHVHPSCEIAAVEPLLDQVDRVMGKASEGERTLLLDGGYNCGKVAQLAVDRDINLLCPERGKKSGKKAKAKSNGKPTAPAKFAKSDFRYDEVRDVYVCPQGELLPWSGRRLDKRRSVEFATYQSRTGVCRACPLKDQCVSSAKNPRRVISRYDHDEASDALRQVMRQPRAQQLYRKRAGMVEPVFSELRGVQGLRKFHRYGLRGARLEFALHACAHNLRRLVAWAAQAPLPARSLLIAALWAILATLWGLLSALSATPRPNWLAQSRRLPDRREQRFALWDTFWRLPGAA